MTSWLPGTISTRAGSGNAASELGQDTWKKIDAVSAAPYRDVAAYHNAVQRGAILGQRTSKLFESRSDRFSSPLPVNNRQGVDLVVSGHVGRRVSRCQVQVREVE